MPDCTDGKNASGSAQQIVERPFYIASIADLLFNVYDAFAFLPLKIFADPERRKAMSERIKAQPTIPGDPTSPWRQVNAIGKALKSKVYSDVHTLGALWDRIVDCHSAEPCMGAREVLQASEEVQADGRRFQTLVLGEYKWLTYKEVGKAVDDVARGLATLGLRHGDKIVMYAETRKEWMVTALACFKLGLVVVTVYATLGEEAVAFAMKQCDAVAIVTVKPLLTKVRSALKDIPQIAKVIYFYDLHQHPHEEHRVPRSVVESFEALGRRVFNLDQVVAEGSNYGLDQVAVDPDDLAMIMYTSGTTDAPKGVMLSHRNIMASVAGQMTGIDIGPGDTLISYLPLAHILEVCVELVCLTTGCRIGYSSAQTLYDRAPRIRKGSKGDCGALEPTLMACVPAIMDRIYKAVYEEIRQSNAVVQEVFRICYERQRVRYEEGYPSVNPVNHLAFDRIGRILGGKLKYILSGGAPLNPETQRFMNICFSCPVVQGYGLTETCAGGTLADLLDLSTGSVGPPLCCTEIVLRAWAEGGYSPLNSPPQGEILVHGPNVAQGYYKNEEKTRENFVQLDGKRFFVTGDIGEFRSDGSLKIIDRKKDLIKLAHGEYISLAKVETILCTHNVVDNICVVGNSMHEFVVALVVPNEKHLKELAQGHQINTEDWSGVCVNGSLRDLVVRELQKHGQSKLMRVEMPKKVWLCKEAWTSAGGLLTEALKLKRKQIEKAFAKEIDEMYA